MPMSLWTAAVALGLLAHSCDTSSVRLTSQLRSNSRSIVPKDDPGWTFDGSLKTQRLYPHIGPNRTAWTKVGDSPGRPLYAIEGVQLPLNTSEPQQCVSVRMELSSHALLVDDSPGDGDAIAWGCFSDLINTTGWNNLKISTTTDPMVPVGVRAFCAGLIEGVLTYKEVKDFRKTVVELLKLDVGDEYGAVSAVDRVIRMSLIAWEEYSGGDAASTPTDDASRQAWAALLQMRGIRDGFNILAADRSSDDPVSMYEMMLMNMHAEIPAITELYSRSEQAKVISSFLQTKSSTHRAEQGGSAHSFLRRHSSFQDSQNDDKSFVFSRWASHMPKGAALVKRIGPLGTPQDLIVAHSTTGNYGEMLRIMKTYKVDFGTDVKRITMSSYPGCVSSTDDYLMTDKGFALMSTNLWIPKEGEYAMPSRTNEGLPSFLRAVVATRVATVPLTWAKIYGNLVGIAGAKQWLIVDYSKFKIGQALPKEGLAFLVESLAHTARAADVSSTLVTNGFFEAHGVPHFGPIRKIFGLSKNGPGSYEEHLESALLDKASTVGTLAMARSVFTELAPARTPVGTGITQLPVASRNDMNSPGNDNPHKLIPEGTIDAKVTSSCMFNKGALQARSGPVVDDKYPPFSWGAFEEWPHDGLPKKWDFHWSNFDGTTITPNGDDDSGAVCEDSYAAQ